ncbi:MAG: signal peptidase I [Gemmatimonadetes bacterium]|nr:MAG: signal peptidase I [Gemmatimonadota bacterium]
MLGLPEPIQPSLQRLITPERKLEALQHVNRGRAGVGFLWDWAKIFTISVVLFFGIKTFLVEAFKIPSGSMERTLLVGDFLLVNKVVYGAELPLVSKRLPGLRRPTRGDVIVFEWPKDRSKNFVKRLVGLPGDTLAMRDGILIRNGLALAEPYVSHSDPEADPVWEEFRWQSNFLVKTAGAAVAYHPSRNNWGPLVVPQAQYFVLGDNRDNSLDSRYWGFVPDSLLRGRPEVVYFSFAPDSSNDFAWLTHVRWTRLGERVH